jgi:tRNA/rRNA methyltransferase
VLATTARGRDVVREILTPEAGARRLRAAAGQNVTSAILFGGERAGLDNDELSLADAVITIPTAAFSSLNLGQAVLLLGYEWLKSADATPASRTRKSPAIPATRQEVVDLFEHLERELDAGGFFFPPAKKDAMVRNIRAMILRAALTDQETRTIRGMIVALAKNKYRGQKTDPRKDGKA